jgi:hypothetical protein
MAGGRGVLLAWSAGVSAAAAGLAALFADGKTSFDHLIFIGFSVVGIAAFLILLGSGIPASWWHLRSRRMRSARSADASGVHSGSRPSLRRWWFQANEAKDRSVQAAAQGGDVIKTRLDKSGRSGGGLPGSLPGRRGLWFQKNVAKDGSFQAVAQGGNVVIHQSGTDHPPARDPVGEENDHGREG